MDTIPSHELIHLLGTYGYWLVLVLVAVESTGVPVPGESVLLAASVYAGSTHRLEVVFVILAAAGGAILGDNLGFLAGRLGGYHLLQRYGRYVRLDERRLRFGRHVFARHGGTVVFAGRFVAVLRMWAAFLAGANRMSWPRFMVCNAAGAALWAGVMGTGAYLLGSSMLRHGGTMTLVSLGLAALLMAGVAVAVRRTEAAWHEQSSAEGDRLAA